ncbi:MAG: hypothetical protein ACTHK0_01505 [Ginsengibacter sp.]
MERIAIEVDEAKDKKWSLASSRFKKNIFEKISESISKILDSKGKENFLVYPGASCIITGNKDLLMLHLFRKIRILIAVDFINKLFMICIVN